MADRLIAKDTSALTLAGSDLLALATSWEIRATRPNIDVSACADDYPTVREGSYEWTVTIEKVIETSGTLMDLFLTGGTAAFTCKEAPTGKTYSGDVRITEAGHVSGGRNGRQVERCTLTGTGALTHS